MENIIKSIFVTGLTGTLGERVAKRLIKDGHRVKGLIRNPNNYKYFVQLGIVPVIGDLNSRDVLFNELKDIDTVIHCAAYLGDDLNLATESNIRGVEVLASISLEQRVKKFVHISTISVYGEPSSGYYDEMSPLAKNHQDVYIQSKVESELVLNGFIDRGLDVIILRAGSICAESNSYWGDRQIDRMRNTDVVNWVHPEDMVPFVHANNLVEMIRLVLSKNISNQTFNAIDGNYSEKNFRVKLVEELGKELIVPNREIESPIYSNDKIKQLGYKPIQSFDRTMINLINLANK